MNQKINDLYLIDSPLNLDQIQVIDKLNISILEKHHVRLIAHCLESFKKISAQLSIKTLPSKAQLISWCNSNPKLANDKEFILILIEQFSAAAEYLEMISITLEIPPLELTLDDLIADALNRIRD
ncbi:hypothetical protein [Prochlorococcus sp. MIT 1223]|uniref:hypothetical protein n=1 Tax=Prochlorococcus sp. MIT 1223 TaxID=3096217 RepID=UPI002A756B0B|nr:hypothetical protein [Prochlorococcus sp. MIT 1223]